MNVHELTWIKFGGEVFRHGLVSNHLKRYVTLYTLLQYENQKYMKEKQKKLELIGDKKVDSKFKDKL